MSNDTKCQMTQNVKWQKWQMMMTNFLKCQESWNVKCHEMSIVMKCQLSWNVNCQQMPNVMKCPISWNADANAGSMTPSRNTQRYTLRSVQSSPRRSFLIWSLIVSKTFHIQTETLKVEISSQIKSELYATWEKASVGHTHALFGGAREYKSEKHYNILVHLLTQNLIVKWPFRKK